MLWYSLEAPRWGASNKYHNVCLCEEMRKYHLYYFIYLLLVIYLFIYLFYFFFFLNTGLFRTMA